MNPQGMRILDRYLSRQVIFSTLFAVAVLSVILVLGQIFKKLLDLLVSGVLTPSAVLKFVGYAFPWSLSYTVPWGVLTAVLLTFGRLSADNELISMRMAGLSLRRICLPVFAAATALSAFCLWINTTVAPHAYTESRKLTQQAALEDPSSLFTPDTPVTAIPGYLVFAQKRNGHSLENVQLFSLAGEKADIARSRPGSVTIARRAEIDDRGLRSKRALEMSMEDAFVVNRRWPAPITDEDRARLSPAEIEAREARIEEASRLVPDVAEFESRSSPVSVPLSRLLERSERIRVDGLKMSELWSGIRNRPALEAAFNGHALPSSTEILTEFHKRLSFSLACLVLALVGIPFGITAQRRETSSGFVLSLVVGISYFTLIMLGELWKDNAARLPYLWVWLPNVAFGGLGLFMFLRLQRR